MGKAEHLAKGPSPLFFVMSLSAEVFDAKTLYEQEECGPGNMENRIKEQQLKLFADRTIGETMRANQIRLCLSTAASIVMQALRNFRLVGRHPHGISAEPVLKTEPAAHPPNELTSRNSTAPQLRPEYSLKTTLGEKSRLVEDGVRFLGAAKR
ncbi:MAG: transposase [Planctomycetaceae bacterium]|nr:transposase [Planctomycetaceae bacterium]